MNYHTFTFPEDRCARLLVKNLGRGMTESDVREDLEFLNIRVLRFQGVTQPRFGRRDPDAAKDRRPAPHFIVSVACGSEESKVRSLAELWLASLRSLRRREPRVSKPRPPHPHRPVWWSAPRVPPPHWRKSHIYSITFPSMYGADSSAPHVHLFHPHRCSSPSRFPVDRHSL